MQANNSKVANDISAEERHRRSHGSRYRVDPRADHEHEHVATGRHTISPRVDTRPTCTLPGEAPSSAIGDEKHRGLDPTFGLRETSGQRTNVSLDIASFSQNELLVMLAALLTKITTTNDRLYTNVGESPYTPRADSPLLAFHARNVPSISIQAYLMRILKYCPMSSDIFLSLLVYFDRMTRLGVPCRAAGGDAMDEMSGPADDTSAAVFAVDSYNIHRLVIAAIVVASKFCSDVFYTNSRYAKVGGLPLAELNHLEFQFLLLNDFRLLIPLEDLQRYADQLLVFWEHETARHGERHA